MLRILIYSGATSLLRLFKADVRRALSVAEMSDMFDGVQLVLLEDAGAEGLLECLEQFDGPVCAVGSQWAEVAAENGWFNVNNSELHNWIYARFNFYTGRNTPPSRESLLLQTDKRVMPKQYVKQTAVTPKTVVKPVNDKTPNAMVLTVSSTEEVLKERSARMAVLEINDELLTYNQELSKDVDEANTSVTKLKAEKDSLNGQLNKVKCEVAEESRKMLKLAAENARLNERIDRQDVEIERKEAEISDIRERYSDFDTRESALKEELIALSAKNASVTEQLEQKEILLRSLQTGQIVGESARTIAAQSEALRKQLQSARAESNEREVTITNLRSELAVFKRENDKLNGSLKAVSGVSLPLNGEGTLSISYNGGGFIVPVFGSPGCGVTSTAVALARTVSEYERVCIVDFNVVSPDMESRFLVKNTNRKQGDTRDYVPVQPLVTGIPGIGRNDGTNSGLGIFVKYGFDFFAKNYDSIVARVTTTKDGVLDYISGLYVMPDMSLLTGTSLSELFSFLGTQYRNVIIDFGMVGANPYLDRIIAAVMQFASRSVVVTPAAREKARVTHLRIKKLIGEQQFNNCMSHAVWVMNMLSGKLDAVLKTISAPAAMVWMPIINDMVGVYGDFTRASGSGRNAFDNIFKAVTGV